MLADFREAIRAPGVLCPKGLSVKDADNLIAVSTAIGNYHGTDDIYNISTDDTSCYNSLST